MISHLHHTRRGRGMVTAAAMLGAGILPAGALHAQISAPELKVVNDQHVNVLTSSDFAATMEITEPLLSMRGGEGEVQYVRYLSKQGPWRDNYKYLIDVSEPSNISVLLGDQMHTFSTMYPVTKINGVDYLGDGQGNTLSLVYVNGVPFWQYLSREGMKVAYDSNLNVAAFITYPNGLTRTFHYKQKPGTSPPVVRLQSVVQSDGTMIKYTYATNDGASNTGAWFRVAGVALVNQSYAYCDPMADQCPFALSDWPSVTFTGPANNMAPSGQTVIEYATTSSGYGRTYTRDMYGRIVGIANRHNGPNDLTISYQGTGWGVSQIVNGQGDVRTYKLLNPTGNSTLDIRSSYANASDSYYFNYNVGMGMPSRVTDRLGRHLLYTWSIPDRHLLSLTYPEGNAETLQYDARFNITTKTRVPKSGSGETSVSERAIFDVSCVNINTCNQPNAYIDPKGNQTDYTYAPFGGKASELGAAPTPGAPRPLKLYTYVQRTAYALNSAGALAPAGQSIWKLSTETNCQTEANSSVLACDPNAIRTDTTYIYGADGTPDALLVHGKREVSGNKSRLTCYAYDRFRRKISETAPNANLQVCP